MTPTTQSTGVAAYRRGRQDSRHESGRMADDDRGAGVAEMLRAPRGRRSAAGERYQDRFAPSAANGPEDEAERADAGRGTRGGAREVVAVRSPCLRAARHVRRSVRRDCARPWPIVCSDQDAREPCPPEGQGRRRPDVDARVCRAGHSACISGRLAKREFPRPRGPTASGGRPGCRRCGRPDGCPGRGPGEPTASRRCSRSGHLPHNRQTSRAEPASSGRWADGQRSSGSACSREGRIIHMEMLADAEALPAITVDVLEDRALERSAPDGDS